MGIKPFIGLPVDSGAIPDASTNRGMCSSPVERGAEDPGVRGSTPFLATNRVNLIFDVKFATIKP